MTDNRMTDDLCERVIQKLDKLIAIGSALVIGLGILIGISFAR